jgi:hypothetical protein
MVTGAVLFPLMRLPGVQLFECVRMPHYPAGRTVAREPERKPHP